MNGLKAVKVCWLFTDKDDSNQCLSELEHRTWPWTLSEHQTKALTFYTIRQELNFHAKLCLFRSGPDGPNYPQSGAEAGFGSKLALLPTARCQVTITLKGVSGCLLFQFPQLKNRRNLSLLAAKTKIVDTAREHDVQGLFAFVISFFGNPGLIDPIAGVVSVPFSWWSIIQYIVVPIVCLLCAYCFVLYWVGWLEGRDNQLCVLQFCVSSEKDMKYIVSYQYIDVVDKLVSFLEFFFLSNFSWKPST